MPITQVRMLELLDGAEALRDDGEFIRQQIKYWLETSKTPEELVSALWDLTKPNPELQNALLVVQLERRHFQRFGKANQNALAKLHKKPAVQSAPKSTPQPTVQSAAQSTQQSTQQSAPQPKPNILASLPHIQLPESTGAVPALDSPLFGNSPDDPDSPKEQ